MTYASRQLVDELQKAVASRSEKKGKPKQEVKLPSFHYQVSPEIAAYLDRVRDYRERAKKVRVGEY